ncbi:MAG: bifunctional 3'-5' exonuclease/DNA polymerase [Firmicutes bacterium]|nr:bifunctional 3'-5' exonuclease/DNA polymerase [Bacillota bacterium]
MKLHIIVNQSQLDQAMSNISRQKYVALYMQTEGPDPHLHLPIYLGLNCDREDVWLLDFRYFDSREKLNPLKRVLEDENIIKVMYDAKKGIQFFHSLGLEPRGTWFDPYLAAKLLLTPESKRIYSLPQLYLEHLDYVNTPWPEYGQLKGEKEYIAFAQSLTALLPLRQKLVKDLVAAQLVEVAKVEFDCIYAVAEMEETGMYLNTEDLELLGRGIRARVKELEKILLPFFGTPRSQLNLMGANQLEKVNLDSPEQLLQALKRKGIEAKDTTRHTLNMLARNHEEISALLEYRKLSKQLNTFIDALPKFVNPKTGRVHSHYDQMGSASGRFSCSSPNIQQTPREKSFRACWQAEPGKSLIIADYSQIELRVAAEIAGDQRMIKAYQKGEDLHKLTASLVRSVPLSSVTPEQRQAAKAINFGLIYAMGARGLMNYSVDTYSIDMTLAEAERFRELYFRAYRGIDRWHGQLRAEDARRRKQKILSESRTLTGRRYIWGGRAGVAGLYNMPVQGTAADITKIALSYIVEERDNPEWRIVASVHDEILMEVPEEEALEAAYFLKRQMERAGKRLLKIVPVVAEAEIAKSWAG